MSVDLDLEGFTGPIPLNGDFPTTNGVYVVACGDCLAHVATATDLRARFSRLSKLSANTGGAHLVCVAWKTRSYPQVWYQTTTHPTVARRIENALRRKYHQPLRPLYLYGPAQNAKELHRAMIGAVAPGSWEAGYIDAIFHATVAPLGPRQPPGLESSTHHRRPGPRRLHRYAPRRGGAAVPPQGRRLGYSA